MTDFGGARTLVVGGGSGIGRASAHMLADRGARVTIADIDLRKAKLVADEIGQLGFEAHALLLDVADSEQTSLQIAALDLDGPAPAILINAAGVLQIGPAVDTTADDFDRVIQVNLRGTFFACTAFARALVAAGNAGSIVNLSSIHAVLSEPNAGAYTASKGGVEAMSRTFASEWAQAGIRVNCVRPGATRTEMTEQIYTTEVLAALSQRVPMRTPASPEQIAEAVCFLASPAASYCTGTTLDVDGGYVMNGSLPGSEYRNA